MFLAAAELQRQRDDARATQRQVDEEIARIDDLERAVVSAAQIVRPALDSSGSASQRAAQQMIVAAQRAARDSRLQLEKHAQTAAAEPRWEPIAERIYAAAGHFFEHHSLPGTRWKWQWTAIGEGAHAEATGHAGRFTTSFDIELSMTWRAPVRIGGLAPNLVLQLPRKRVFGVPTVGETELDRAVLVEASVDANGRTLVLRERVEKSFGWKIVIPVHGSARCNLLDKEGQVSGPDFEVARDVHLDRLWTAIDTEIAGMHRTRHAREVLLGDISLRQLADVTAAPATVLDFLAPIVRMIRSRSRVPGELTLKRDVVDGVREELYVPRSAITARYAQLPVEYRLLLDEAGFGRDMNTGSESTVAPAQQTITATAPARQSQPRLARASPSPPIADTTARQDFPLPAPPRASAIIPQPKATPPALAAALTSPTAPTMPAVSAPVVPANAPLPRVPREATPEEVSTKPAHEALVNDSRRGGKRYRVYR
jgi:hypothetical protein